MHGRRDKKRDLVVVATDAGNIQCVVVGKAIFLSDDCRWIAPLQQFEIQQQTSRSSVPIDKRMDLHEPRVQLGRSLDRMHCLGLAIPFDQHGHFSRNAHEVRRGRARTGDYDVLPPISASLLRIDALEDEGVQIANLPFGKRLMLRDNLLDIENRVPVIRCLEVFTKRLTTDGNALQYDLGFPQRQRIAFDRVRMIRPFHSSSNLKA